MSLQTADEVKALVERTFAAINDRDTDPLWDTLSTTMQRDVPATATTRTWSASLGRKPLSTNPGKKCHTLCRIVFGLGAGYG